MRSLRFRRRPDGAFDADLHLAEVELLGQVLDGLEEVVRADSDPAHERLYPTAFEGDPEANSDWSFLTRDTLSRERMERIGRVRSTLEEGRRKRARWTGLLAEDDALAWLGAVNDARLVLGTRLEVTEEMYEDPPASDDPRRAGFEVYTFLGWLEQELLEGMDPTLDDPVSGGSPDA